nr:amidohydrolase [uncultured Sphingomonas sp.]
MKFRRIALPALFIVVAAPALPGTLINNANGVTVDANGKIRHFTGILIGDDGKVVRLLNGEMMKLPADTKVVNAGGRTVMPGLIDAHGHIMGLGFAVIQLDLVGTQSMADLQSRLNAYAAANPGDGWIYGFGWNQELWPVKTFPTSADLDAIAPDRPVVLERVDGHALVANRAAMIAAGVTTDTQAPTGGRIQNGLFVDAAMELIKSHIPKPDVTAQDRAFAEAQKAMLSVGLVGAADMGTSVDDWATFRRAGEDGRMKVRVFSYAFQLPAWHEINNGQPTGWMYGERLKLAGAKFVADGALGSRGAWLKRPYQDHGDTRGLNIIPAADLLKQAGEVAAGGGQLAIHAIGDATNDEVITTYEKLAAQYGRTKRWRIEHLQIADPKDLRRLKGAGIIASMQPTHATSDWGMAEARLGKDRLGGAYAWHSIEKMGVPLAFGSDFPIEPPNPFFGLSAAISRQDAKGQPPGGWRPWERVSLGRALHGFTRGAAYAGKAKATLGCLDPGCQADFIIVDRDPTNVDAQALRSTKVLETWVGGERVFIADAQPAR